MLYIGDWNKQRIIDEYIQDHDIKKVLVIYSDRTAVNFDISLPLEVLELKESIKYVNYYHMLEYVDKWTLVIIDNVLRSQHRRSLEHNCVNVITNQSKHKLVFNYLPFIDNQDDFMTLLDFNDKNKYSVELFNKAFIRDPDVHIRLVPLELEFIDVPISDKDIERYEAKKESLFNSIGDSDPDTIPNNLSLLAGDIRYKNLGSLDCSYIARNQRFKDPNVHTYKEKIWGRILDFPIGKPELIDMLTNTRQYDIAVATSRLKVDVYNMKEYNAWFDRLGDFYDEANVQ